MRGGVSLQQFFAACAECSGLAGALPWLTVLAAVAVLLGLVLMLWLGRGHRHFGTALWLGTGAVLMLVDLQHWAVRDWAVSPAALVILSLALLSLLMGASRVARRVVLRALPVAILFALLGYAAYLAFSAQLDPKIADDLRMIQAVIAGGVVAAGWIVTFTVQELRTEQARKATEEEMMIALAFEIMDALKADFMDWARFGEIWQKIAGSPDEPERPSVGGSGGDSGGGSGGARAGEVYHPFIPTVKPTPVFDALAGQAHLLPAAPLAKLITYYTQMADVAAIVNDMRGDGFRTLPSDRRARVFLTAYEMQRNAREFGHDALKAIRTALPPTRPIRTKKIDEKMDRERQDSPSAELQARLQPRETGDG